MSYDDKSTTNTPESPVGNTPDSDSLTTGQFLKLYFSQCQTGYAEICYLAPEGVKLYPKLKTAWKPLPTGDVVDYPAAISQHNQSGYGCFFGTTVSGVKHDPVERISEKSGRPYLAYQRRKEVDVILAPALWLDMDDVDPVTTRLALLNIPAMPSIINQSGGGVHAYWLLDEPVQITPETHLEFKRVIHGLASYTGGGDAKVRDLARIMRLPGTVNTKPERQGTRCETIHCLPAFYRYDQLRDLFIHHAPREVITPKRSLPAGVIDNTRLPAVTQKYLDNPPGKGSRNQSLFAAARGCNDAGLGQSICEQLLSAKAAETGLADHEIRSTIASAYRYVSTPTLPTYMSQRMAMGDHLK